MVSETRTVDGDQADQAAVRVPAAQLVLSGAPAAIDGPIRPDVPTFTTVSGLHRSLRPEEAVFAMLGLALVGLVVVVREPLAMLAGIVTSGGFLAVLGGLAALALGRSYRRTVSPLGSFEPAGTRHRRAFAAAADTLRVAIPLLGCLISYTTLHDITPKLRPAVLDPRMVAIDRAVFGVDVPRWLDDHIASVAMTHIMVLCYLSYGLVPPMYAYLLYFRKAIEPYRDFAVSVALTALLGYSGYALVPVVGPHIFQTDVYRDPLPGAEFALGMIGQVQGSARDGFPSLHTAMTVVLAVLMWRDARRLFWCYLPVGLGLLLSTLYLRRHYAVDLAAGLATAAFALALAPRLNRWWYARRRAAADPGGAGRPGDRQSGAGPLRTGSSTTTGISRSVRRWYES